MKFIGIEGTDLKLIEVFHSKDDRGEFTKIFNADEFERMGIGSDFQESYYTKSAKGVIRGMHFQTPPYGHAKLVHVIAGEIIDVVLDIRKNSQTYGKITEIHLSAQDAKALYIPEGYAHGFRSMQENTIVSYYVTSGYERDNDKGIRWDSIGYEWNETEPILSERDLQFPAFGEFESPFEV